ncbi:unnamed protein product, partial [Medioppia subpectinata]
VVSAVSGVSAVTAVTAVDVVGGVAQVTTDATHLLLQTPHTSIVDNCLNSTAIEAIDGKCETISGSHVDSKLQEMDKKCKQFENENQLLKRDLKRKEKIIKALVQKLRSNLTSTQKTVDAIEKQLLTDCSLDSNPRVDDLDSEAILPQDFLDFEMNQELMSEPSVESGESELSSAADNTDGHNTDGHNTDEEWSPKKSGYRKLTKDGKYRCKWLGCGKLFSRNANLTRHYNTHLRNRCHVCQWTGCGKRFTDLNQCSTHSNQLSDVDIVANIRAISHTNARGLVARLSLDRYGLNGRTKPVITYSVNQASILAYHRKSHTSEREGRSETKQLLTSQTNHGLNEPFVCDLIGCEKTFDNVTNLRRHQAIHNGTRLYYCDWQGCDKNFLELSGLKRHRRIHTGERPYKCDWPGCGARYSQSSHLSTHIKSHKNQRDYKCSLPECAFAGVRMSDLRKHLRRKHKWQQSDFDHLDTAIDTAIDTAFPHNLIQHHL